MRRTVVTLLLAIAGIALLWWMVQQVGPDRITGGFRAVGAGFVVVLVLSFARFVLRSLAWSMLTGGALPLGAAVAATISGDALGNLTPLGLLASEPAKAAAVGRHLPPARALAALTAENFFYSVSVAIYVILAAAAMLLAFPRLDEPFRWAGAIALAGMAGVLAGAAWIAWRQPSVLATIARRVPIRRLQAIVDRVRQFEVDTYGAAGPSTGRIGRLALIETTFHILSLAECWYVFGCLTGSFSASLILPSLVLDGFNRVVNVVFKPIPGRLVVDEVGTGGIARAIGYAFNDGFVLGLVRKARVFVWAMVGVGILLAARTSSQKDPHADKTDR